jgi:hypothetical protein
LPPPHPAPPSYACGPFNMVIATTSPTTGEVILSDRVGQLHTATYCYATLCPGDLITSNSVTEQTPYTQFLIVIKMQIYNTYCVVDLHEYGTAVRTGKTLYSNTTITKK